MAAKGKVDLVLPIPQACYRPKSFIGFFGADRSLWNVPTVAADKNLARGNDTVFSMHLKEKMLPVTSRLERRFIR